MNQNTLTDEELCLQYRTDLTPYAEIHQRRYQKESADVAARFDGKLNIPYGPAGLRQTLDVFTPDQTPAPVLVFIHGGFWHFNSKDPRRFPAPAWLARGVAWVPINYRLAPDVGMDEIVADVRAAVAWLYEHGADYGCDPERIYVSGNSAGGHLTAMLITGDWHSEHRLPADVIKGACAVSPLSDLEPLLACEPNVHLAMDRDCACRNSPINHVPRRDGPALIVACGASESDEFRRQARILAQAWQAHGFDTTHLELSGHDHFSIIGEFARPESALFQALDRMVTR